MGADVVVGGRFCGKGGIGGRGGLKRSDVEVQGGGTDLGWSGGGSYLSADPLLFAPKVEVECLANRSTRGGRYIVVWMERRDEFDGRGRGGRGMMRKVLVCARPAGVVCGGVRS